MKTRPKAVRIAMAKRMPDDIYYVVSIKGAEMVVVAMRALEYIPRKHAA
jgi:hypothetical protein